MIDQTMTILCLTWVVVSGIVGIYIVRSVRRA